MISLYFIHGWASNSAVWSSVISAINTRCPESEIVAYDMLGYGSQRHKSAGVSFDNLVDDCITHAPDNAIWVGWSLGGLLALAAAQRLSQKRYHAPKNADQVVKKLAGLQLINSTPRFTRADDWPCGQTLEALEKTRNQFSKDYTRAIGMFFTLQCGRDANAKKLALEVVNNIQAFPSPLTETIDRGLDYLAEIDLRSSMTTLHGQSIPVQIIKGLKDRVVHPGASDAMGLAIGVEPVEFDTGHMPFISAQNAYINELVGFAKTVGEVAHG